MVEQQLLLGDLVFVRGISLIDHIIEDITHSPYSHVAIAVSSTQLIEAQSGEPVEYVPSSKYAGQTDVYRSSLAPDVLKGIIAYASDSLGEHYSYALLAEEFIREETGIQLPFDEDELTVCSVLVSDAVRSQGIGFCQGIEYPAPSDEAKDGLYHYVFSF